ncbi:hypothetical protein SAMN05216464_108182 [Mucilaginibacter pineti]|uniref:Uncharacterized protein n=1 Tax=Mucilaginibacter pineti TaxID=1391627 RepID=A0A1G7EW28_9SPHI|nr:hypothetical protein [Mucilaginibacter pineti]SDE67802.1 hypothetical protein SAMN05216464_108182 [Mucilaginibacter pineti]
MSWILKIWGVIFFTIILYSDCAFAQTSFENELQKRTDSLLAPLKARDARDELLPNSVLQNLTTPSGWGGYGSYIFGGIGGDYAQPYAKKADLISFGGFCVGDPQKAVNVAVSINVTDVSKVSDFSGNLVISRQIFTGSSISAGTLQLFASPHKSDAPGSTFYFAFSHAIQLLPSKTEGSSKLSYTIGIGTGRFYNKSPDDIKTGKGTHGTAVFGSASYELLKKVNFNIEWSGMNLGCSFGIKPFDSPLAIGVGITNLTRYSSDKPNSAFVISYPLSIKR